MTPFNILIESPFASISTDKSLTPISKKHVLSLVNDFEDGKWMSDAFHNFIWDNIELAALSYSERQKLVGSSTKLSEAARKLRLTDKEKDPGKGSELAEIILYAIMSHYYKALPVVPKIFYKQNENDYAKGADSVHIVINGNEFSIWLGEAKFYNNIEDARLSEIISSIESTLTTDKLKKENSIITGVSDLGNLVTDKNLREKIMRSLDTRKSIDHLKPKLHVPILLLYECEITKKAKIGNKAYTDEIIKYHTNRANSYFTKQISKLNGKLSLYSEISFHIILLPTPEKSEVVKAFLDAAKFHKKKK